MTTRLRLARWPRLSTRTRDRSDQRSRGAAGTRPARGARWRLAGLAGMVALAGCSSLGPLQAARLASPAGSSAAAGGGAGPTSRVTVPIAFEANVGQAAPEVRFLTRGRGHVALLTDTGALLAWEPPAPPGGPRAARVARLELVGARPGVRAEAEEPRPGRVHHLVGDREAWRTGVPTFGRVRQREVYPGIDLVWHGAEGRLEFDLVVAPGADPARIRLRLDGAGALALDPRGGLALGDGGVVLGRPAVYQDGPEGRRSVDARYVLRGGGEVALALGPHDAARALVIDPVVTFSTYFGGSGDDGAVRFAADAAGNLYLAGTTSSPDLPAAGGLQPQRPGFRSCFVTKLDPTASTVLYSTYLGGNLDDQCLGMAVDGPGNVYLTGTASSLNFPVTAQAAQPQPGGGGADAFVSVLGPGGDLLLYSTYLGGNGNDVARGIAIDGAGSAWVNGTTTSLNFPVKGAFQAAFAGVTDGFLARVDTTGIGPASLIFSTYFGGSGADGGSFQGGLLAADGGVAVDGAGNAFIAGSTTSIDLPVVQLPGVAPVRAAFQGVADAFVARFGPDGALLWSTYLGGSAADVALAVATDSLGNVYVAGTTSSIDFPVFRAVQPVKQNGSDGFVTKLDPSGLLIGVTDDQVVGSGGYSTFLGGSNEDSVLALFVDVFGRVHLTGATTSPDLPLVQAVQGPPGGGSDAFVAVLGPAPIGLSTAGVALEMSTYLGGTGSEAGASIFADPLGIIHVAGSTGSLDFPLARPLQAALRGATDAFLAQIASERFVNAAVLPITRSVQAPAPATFFATMQAFGTGLATGCGIQPVTPTPTTFLFQRTDPATNALVGQPNTLVNIPAGGLQTFLVAFTPDAGAAFESTEIVLNFSCLNTPPAQLIHGVNAPTLSVSATPVPDVVALAATAGNDGILTLDTPTAPPQAGAGAFAVATVNLGASGLITVSADDNGAKLGLSLFVCATDPATSVCATPPAPSVEVQIDGGQTPTFAVYAVAERPVPFDPARNRVFARFRDGGGVERGATSVAVRTP